MTGKKKREPALKLDMNFDEALRRFTQVDPKEVAEIAFSDVLRQQQEANTRIANARKELKDGARPRKGRFRL